MIHGQFSENFEENFVDLERSGSAACISGSGRGRCFGGENDRSRERWSAEPVEADIGERRHRMADGYWRKSEVIRMTARCMWKEEPQRVMSTRLILPDADASF